MVYIRYRLRAKNPISFFLMLKMPDRKYPKVEWPTVATRKLCSIPDRQKTDSIEL